jgi:2-polyprenyl-3-methyl-5-hydroxy-6-metoxy-1,4-benzoquinol methylase
VDGSEEMIKICRNNYAQISFIHDYLPFKNQGAYTKQDAIVCSSVLEYTSDYETIIKQFSAILNPAGILMVSMPNDDCWYRKIEKYIFRFTGKPTYYPHLKQVIKATDFSRKLAEYGFDLQVLQYYPNTHLFTKTLNYTGLHPKYTHTMFVGVYKLNRNNYQI